MSARPVARLRALIGGYFWKPCPVCREMFGGHEIGGLLSRTDGTSHVTCRNCPGQLLDIDGVVWELRVLFSDCVRPTPALYVASPGIAPSPKQCRAAQSVLQALHGRALGA